MNNNDSDLYDLAFYGSDVFNPPTQSGQVVREILLTDDFIKTGLHCPEELESIEYRDTELVGLCVIVRPGRSAYCVRHCGPTGQWNYQQLGQTDGQRLSEVRAIAK